MDEAVQNFLARHLEPGQTIEWLMDSHPDEALDDDDTELLRWGYVRMTLEDLRIIARDEINDAYQAWTDGTGAEKEWSEAIAVQDALSKRIDSLNNYIEKGKRKTDRKHELHQLTRQLARKQRKKNGQNRLDRVELWNSLRATDQVEVYLDESCDDYIIFWSNKFNDEKKFTRKAFGKILDNL